MATDPWAEPRAWAQRQSIRSDAVGQAAGIILELLAALDRAHAQQNAAHDALRLAQRGLQAMLDAQTMYAPAYVAKYGVEAARQNLDEEWAREAVRAIDVLLAPPAAPAAEEETRRGDG
jgi:hypothetical protein